MQGVHGRGGGVEVVDMLGAGGNSHIDLSSLCGSQHVGAGSRLRVETSVRAPPDGGESRCHAEIQRIYVRNDGK